MIIPCIDLMGGKVVQLVQGRDKKLELDDFGPLLQSFQPFRVIQVIDLDAARGHGSNDRLVRAIAARGACRVGGGIRSAARAKALVEAGAGKVIVGTAAFDEPVLRDISNAVGPSRVIVALDSKGGEVVVAGWTESTHQKAEDWLEHFEPYCSGFLCTYVDKEGMLQGTDLDWFRRLRARTRHEITAAGGITTLNDVQALKEMNVNAALGMAIYTGALSLKDLAVLQ